MRYASNWWKAGAALIAAGSQSLLACGGQAPSYLRGVGGLVRSGDWFWARCIMLAIPAALALVFLAGFRLRKDPNRTRTRLIVDSVLCGIVWVLSQAIPPSFGTYIGMFCFLPPLFVTTVVGVLSELDAIFFIPIMLGYCWYLSSRLGRYSLYYKYKREKPPCES